MVRAAWARASYERRCNLTEPHAIHRWEMLRDREADPRGLDRGDLLPRRRAVGGAEHAVVVLDPKGIGLGPTLDQVVRILNVGIILTLGRHVRRAHALGTAFPGRTAVPGHP